MKDQIGEWVDEAMAKYSSDAWHSGQIRYEIYELTKRVEEIKPKVVIEIGTDLGETLFLWGKVCDGTVISIDLPNGLFGTGKYTDERMPLYRTFGKDIQLIRDDSHSASTLQQVKEILNGREVDFLFIDGDHSYDGASDDFLIYSPLVRKGGMIAFHDIAEPDNPLSEVNKVWNKIKETNEENKAESFRLEEIIENEVQGWAGIGMLWK